MIMKYCHKCGYSLSTENFCPQCGIKSIENEVKNDDGNDIDVTDNISDLIDTEFKSDGGNIMDKKIDYVVHQNAIHLQESGDDTSNRILKKIQRLMSISIRLEPPSSLGSKLKENYPIKSEKANTAYQQIQIILNEAKIIEEKTGIEIKDINIGDL